MRIKPVLAATTIVVAFIAAAMVVGGTFGNDPASADSTTADRTTTSSAAVENVNVNAGPADAASSAPGDVSDVAITTQDDDAVEHENENDGDDDGADEEEGAHLASEATISAEEAIAIASAKVDGVAGSVELERENGRLLYEISFDSGYEVEVDAETGAVVEVERDDD